MIVHPKPYSIYFRGTIAEGDLRIATGSESVLFCVLLGVLATTLQHYKVALVGNQAGKLTTG